jgi:hypothetical protein
VLSERAAAHDKDLTASESEELRQRIRKRVHSLLDTWQSIATEMGELQYQDEVGRLQRLLYTPLDPELEKISAKYGKFKAQRSMRDVEPTVNLKLRNPDGWDVVEST